MSDFVVVDSSVAFKWFNSRDENSVADALELLDGHVSGRQLLAAPAHLPVSPQWPSLHRVGSVFVVAGHRGLTGAVLILFPLDAKLLLGATELALEHDLPIHEALFAALAVHLECELVTADRAQACVSECAVRLLS